jgi:hypothetical protein
MRTLVEDASKKILAEQKSAEDKDAPK